MEFTAVTMKLDKEQLVKAADVDAKMTGEKPNQARTVRKLIREFLQKNERKANSSSKS